MKKFLSLNRGVTLPILVAAVIMLIIMSSMLTYNTLDGLKLRAYNNLCNDIESLDDKISIYYSNYGSIPVSVKYCNKDQLKGIVQTVNINDNDNYYVIDISALENLTLTYGKDYEKSKENYDISIQRDVYIINEQSHQIYYPKGIVLDDITYYTNGEVDAREVIIK